MTGTIENRVSRRAEEEAEEGQGSIRTTTTGGSAGAEWFRGVRRVRLGVSGVDGAGVAVAVAVLPRRGAVVPAEEDTGVSRDAHFRDPLRVSCSVP